MALKEIQHVALGSDIIIGVDLHGKISQDNHTYGLRATIIGRYYGQYETCIAWRLLPMSLSRDEVHKVSDTIDSWRMNSKYQVSGVADKFKYYKWVNRFVLVQEVDSLVEEYANQKCIGCDLPAPHVKANLPDNKFQCVSCKVLEMLG